MFVLSTIFDESYFNGRSAVELIDSHQKTKADRKRLSD